MATRKNLRFKKKTSFKKKGRKTQNKKRNYKKTKKCGCSIKFFGGKKKQRKLLKSKKQKGGAGLTAILPSEINNLGQSIYHSMKYNNAVYTGNDYPVNPHPSIQPNMNKHN